MNTTELPEQGILQQNDFDWDTAPVICELNGERWVLGPECDKILNLEYAVKWCESVGGVLPPRDVLFLCYMNEEIRKLFTEKTYWANAEALESHGWGQRFDCGSQKPVHVTSGLHIRAVKRIPH